MYPIASQTASSGSSITTFSNIPQTFTHLQIRVYGRSDYDRGSGNTVPVSLYCTFNGDGAANYSWHLLTGDGSTASSNNTANATGIHLSTSGLPAFRAPANTFGNYVIDILDYANTNKYKTTKSLGGVDQNGSGALTFNSGNWRSTSAITSIAVFCDGNFALGTRIDLYGISISNATGA